MLFIFVVGEGFKMHSYPLTRGTIILAKSHLADMLIRQVNEKKQDVWEGEGSLEWLSFREKCYIPAFQQRVKKWVRQGDPDDGRSSFRTC